MKFVRSLLIFSYGFFTIAAQSLLFREFLTTFEGNDISVGVFFASWFLWVGLGAVIVNKVPALAEKLLKNIELLFLIYLPAFVLELILIIQARELAGIESYTLLSISSIVLLSIVVNAPVSLITGMLFPTACRWIETEHKQPVSRVYLIEAMGSFTGGLSVTLLLTFEMSLAKVFFILAFLLSLSVFLVKFAQTGQNPKLKVSAGITFIISFCVLLCFLFGVDKILMRHLRIAKWRKLLPVESLTGSFQTSQAEYLYGTYQNQWTVLSQGSIFEVLPAEASVGRTAAIALCQKPDAERVLVVGSGLGLCRELLRLPQIQTITWTHCDGEYVRRINRFIPPELRINDPRFHFFTGDIRLLLDEQQQSFDIVIINLPDATSSVLNRYYTLEFYQQIRESLGPGGILAVRIAGGENIMGTELLNLGASTKLTLEKVFSHLVLTPGEDTFFLSSDSENLTGRPGVLRDRFASIEGAEHIFPPQGIHSVYLPDRAAAAMDSYSKADLPDNLLINRDTKPLTHLYSLLFTAKQSGTPTMRMVEHLILAGPLAFIIPVIVFVVLRSIYLLKSKQQEEASTFDSSSLVFLTGWVAIGMIIVLMYLYQTYFGSLYLHIGIISSLFMLGLTFGAGLTRLILAKSSGRKLVIILCAVAFLHSLILCTIALWPSQQWSHLAFASFFILCGLFSGCYFPIAAKQLSDSDFETGQVAAKLETADHIGASVAGLATSLVLVPILGTKITVFISVLLILINLPPALINVYKPAKTCSSEIAYRLRRLGYSLFAVALSVILCSNLLVHVGAKIKPSLPEYVARSLAGQLQIEQVSAATDDAGKISYYKVYDNDEQLNGYIFSSEDLEPQVRGYGGKINLAVYVGPTGKLVDFHIIHSNETPAYMQMLTQWLDSLKGRVLFDAEPFDGLDTVTGATVSSQAILTALQKSGHKFTTQILGRPLQPGDKDKAAVYNFLPDITATYLIAAFLLSLIVIRYGGFWSRLVVLCLNLIAGGIIFNAQYSTEQIMTVLSLNIPMVSLSGAFVLIIAIPLLVIFFGNIYCGYICPFGAMQEILGLIIPTKYKPVISQQVMQKARFIKYIVLFVLLTAFFLSRERKTLAADPLISSFNMSFFLSLRDRFAFDDLQLLILLIIAATLIGSVFYTRFWCRYLCPAGAFLSLCSGSPTPKLYQSAKNFGNCEFGLTHRDRLDCIYCDKCRFEKTKKPKTQKQKAATVFWPCVLVVLTLVMAVSIGRFLQTMPSGFDQVAVSASAGGRQRSVDTQRIRDMIQQKRLSDREAKFYKKVEQKEPHTADKPQNENF